MGRAPSANDPITALERRAHSASCSDAAARNVSPGMRYTYRKGAVAR